MLTRFDRSPTGDLTRIAESAVGGLDVRGLDLFYGASGRAVRQEYSDGTVAEILSYSPSGAPASMMRTDRSGLRVTTTWTRDGRGADSGRVVEYVWRVFRGANLASETLSNVWQRQWGPCFALDQPLA